MLRTLKMMLAEKLYGTPLYEMAYTISELRAWLTPGNLSQIAQNWCLIKYCSLYDKNSIYKKGWSKELFAKMSDYQRMLLKGNKEKITKNAIIDKAEMDKVSTISNYIYIKWKNEHLEKDERYYKVIDDFIKELPTIIKYLSVNKLTEKDILELEDYCYNKI